ncbi:MAG: pyridoxal 5'-phosphate synthase glutaminase subunit PdxT [Bifidobacterium sp.]|uniref:pyridoxal 5'-phosphate synthase glutaminase subunit PdxT n=1 Tax=Bifidobacterium sp. TaxID=41200 RepID=UPI0039EADEA7
MDATEDSVPGGVSAAAPVIGVLALQGAFAEHESMLASLGVKSVEIRQLRDLDQNLDGLILPGGESTVQGKLLQDLHMLAPMRRLIENGLPTFGTCAGLLLLAKRVEDGDTHLGIMDITAKRNAYGRQLGSFFALQSLSGVGEIPMTFIRAPYIEEVGKGVRALARVDGHVVAAQEGNTLVTSFHPELNDDPSMHRYFIDMVTHG